MRHLVGESKCAHPSLGDAPTALSGVSDGILYTAVFQPSTVTLVVVLETPSSIKLADQRQLGSLTFACMFCLLEGESPRHVEDGACERRKDSYKHPDNFSPAIWYHFGITNTHKSLVLQVSISLVTFFSHIAVEVSRGRRPSIFPLMNFIMSQTLLSSVNLPSFPMSHRSF